MGQRFFKCILNAIRMHWVMGSIERGIGSGIHSGACWVSLRG